METKTKRALELLSDRNLLWAIVRCKKNVGPYKTDKEYDANIVKVFTGKYAIYLNTPFKKDNVYKTFKDSEDFETYFEVVSNQNVTGIEL